MKILNMIKAFTMKKYFPPVSKSLVAQAKIFHKELSWDFETALKIVSELSKKEYAVIGVELWEEVEGSPKWIASSNYNFYFDKGWKKCVKKNKNAAKDFVIKYQTYPKGLFNFSWSNKTQARKYAKKLKKKFESCRAIDVARL